MTGRRERSGEIIMPEFHALANAFPLMAGEAFDELVENVRTNGVLDPVVMFEGKILDGRNRWRAAQKLEVAHSEVKFEDLVKNHKAPEDPAEFVWSKNAVRRQLTASQRAMAATKLTNTELGANRHTVEGKTTMQQAADLAGVGLRSVTRAKAVIDTGTPEVVAAVESGELAVTPAAEIAAKPVEVQRRIMADGPEAAAKTIANGKAKAAPVTPAKSDGPGRGQVGPKVTMTRQMEGSSAEGSKARTVFWAENKELIKDLDSGLLGQFVKDLADERRAIEQLLRLVKLETEGDSPRTTGTATKKAAVKKTTAPRVRKTAAVKPLADLLPSVARKTAAAKRTTENQETDK